LFYRFFSLERYLMKFLACALNNKIKIKFSKNDKKV